MVLTLVLLAFEPDFKGAAFRKKRELVNHLQTRVAPEDFNSYFLFDGGAVGYARSDLAVQLGPTKTVNSSAGLQMGRTS
jgi:hypothetical protein